MWQSIIDWYTENKSLPGFRILETDCFYRLTLDPALNTPEISSDLHAFLSDISEFDPMSVTTEEMLYLMKLLQEVVDDAVLFKKLNEINQDRSVEEVRNLHEMMIGTRVAKASYKSLSEVAEESSREYVGKIPTGFVAFDKMFGGLGAGDVIGLVAPPGAGKTVVGIQVGVDWAKDYHRNTIILCYENLPYPEYFSRSVARATGIPWSRAQNIKNTEDMTDEELALYQEHYVDGLEPWMRIIDCTKNMDGSLGIDTIVRDCLDEGFRPELIVIDQYMQLLNRWFSSPSCKHRDLRLASQALLQEIVSVAVTHQCGVLLLHQMTAAVKGRSPTVKPKAGDYAEDKGFDSWLPQCAMLGTRGESEVSWLISAKTRHSKRGGDVGERLVKLDAENQRFIDVTGKYSARGGGDDFVPINGADTTLVAAAKKRNKMSDAMRIAQKGRS